MARYYVFNGDADGLCALQQLRLLEPGDATLVTGVKRDIKLLERVDAAAGDEVTVLDISLAQNRPALLRLLEHGVHVRYFDHHYAGERPEHPHFEVHIQESGDVCTSIIVDRYIGGRHRGWAIAAAFGDGLPSIARALANSVGFDMPAAGELERLGIGLNYNAYGDSVGDLHVDPRELARQMLAFDDPINFIRRAPAFAMITAGYESDMRRARALKPTRQVPGATTLVLPDAAWARRSIGVLANELVQSQPDSAVAILLPRVRGGFVVSVRVPPGRSMSAEEFCRGYETGGGRKLAAGIDHLEKADVDGFVQRFEAHFRVHE